MAGTDKQRDSISGQDVPEYPSIPEGKWYSSAVATAILTAIAIFSAFCVIFSDGFDGDEDVKLAQALSPFGVALFALVTFCTASWRGSINTRQANQAESEGRAKLLQEGAKLLAEEGKPAHVSAGIATLGVLVNGPDKLYGLQALSLLADYIQDHMSASHEHRHGPQILDVMLQAEQAGYILQRELNFDATSDDDDQYDDEDTFWKYIPAVERVTYRGGSYVYGTARPLERVQNTVFNRTQIRGWDKVDIDNRFFRCRFVNCSITHVRFLHNLNSHSNYKFAFESCDFSDCIIADDLVSLVDFKHGKNFFVEGHAPRTEDEDSSIHWRAIMKRLKQKSDAEYY